MSDELFRLTAIDARHYDFGRALRGYDPVKVEQFREQVAAELERLNRLNQDLDARAKSFHEQLRAFRERDKALNDALISAQQLRAETREQAEREAQLILREARAEGERVAETMRAEARRLAGEVARLERSRRAYLAQLRRLIERQMADLEAAEEAPDSESEGQESPDAESPRAGKSTPAWLDSLVKD